MLNSITWTEYFTVITFLVVCYYGFIGFRFYHLEILSIIGIKKVDDTETKISIDTEFKKVDGATRHEDYQPKPAAEIDISPLVQAFTDEVKACTQQLDDNISRNDLLHSISSIILKYPVLKEADCKQELIQFIFDEVNTQYPDLLQLSEIKQLLG